MTDIYTDLRSAATRYVRVAAGRIESVLVYWHGCVSFRETYEKSPSTGMWTVLRTVSTQPVPGLLQHAVSRAEEDEVFKSPSAEFGALAVEDWLGVPVMCWRSREETPHAPAWFGKDPDQPTH